MKLFFTLLSFIFFQDQIPFKPSDEFQVNIDLKFKVKPSGYGPSSYSANGDPLNKTNSTTFPYLMVDVSQLKIQNDEARIVAINSLGRTLMKKKTLPLPILHFEMGFVDDLKSKTSPNEITVYFLSAEKKQLRKIVFTVSSNGVFQVNGQWHGQF